MNPIGEPIEGREHCFHCSEDDNLPIGSQYQPTGQPGGFAFIKRAEGLVYWELMNPPPTEEAPEASAAGDES